MKKISNLIGTACLVLCMSGSVHAQQPALTGWRLTVAEFAQKNFTHPAWGFSHSVRDYNLAKSLAQTDHVVVDDDVLFAAAYLHDMAAFPTWAKAGVDHADQAALIVDSVLKETGFPIGKLESVRNAIRSHMFDRNPSGAEAIYLHDADALDWLGAIGVTRILALIDPNGGAPDSHAMVGMIEKYTADVPARVISPAGKVQAEQRKAQSLQYLQLLKAESDNLNSL